MIEMFYEWFNALTPYLKVYWVIALITSFVFIIQMILTFIGIGDADADADFGGDTGFSDGNTLDVGGAMQLFTIRNFINFLLGLGWGGVCLASAISNPLLLSLVAFVIGCLFVYVFLVLYKQMFRLEKNGAYHIKDCVGQTVDVYLTIPAQRGGMGKIQVSFNGSVQELAALTNSEQPIRSGQKVRVVELIDNTTVLVEKI